MTIQRCYTSGQSYINLDMIPGVPWRRWNSNTKTCCSGSYSYPYGTIFISSQRNGGWTGVSGAIICLYESNTSNQYGEDFPGQGGRVGASCIISNTWDISANKWLGEYIWSRSSRVGGNYPTTFNQNRFDIGDIMQIHPLTEEHQVICIAEDKYKHLWGVWGGHYGAQVEYGYCYLQCFKSTKPYTDVTWNPSGANSWINMGAVDTNINSGAYPRIITGKCSCHNNWYFLLTRIGSGLDPYCIYYSNNSGSTWHRSITISDARGAVEGSYCTSTFDYDPISDKTLVFIKSCPYTSPGYGFFWTDCHRMSGSSRSPYNTNFYPPTGGFFASDIDPQNVTNTQVIANNCPCAYSGEAIPPLPESVEGTISAITEYYFDDYDVSTVWETDPANMVDSDEGTYAETSINSDVQKLTSTSIVSEIGKTTITAVKLIIYASAAGKEGPGNSITLTAIFNGTPSATTHTHNFSTTEMEQEEFDITSDDGAPSPWTWSYLINNLNLNVTAGVVADCTVRGMIVKLTVTYLYDIPLKSFDRYDDSYDPAVIKLDYKTRKLYGISQFKYAVDSLHRWKNKMHLIWKTMGTTDTWKSSQIWTPNGTQLTRFVPVIEFVSGNNHDRYILLDNILISSSGVGEESYYMTLSGPDYSSMSNARLNKYCSNAISNVLDNIIPIRAGVNVSNDKKFFSTMINYDINDGSYTGICTKESFLSFSNNNIDLYYIKVSGASSIGTATATLTGRVKRNSGNVWVYYDTSDKGTNPSNWYDKSCPYRKKITISGQNISGSGTEKVLTDFPFLFNISSIADTDLKTKAHSGGKDFIFTTSDGITRTHHEIDYFRSGSGQVWVRAPTLNDRTKATFYLYYGDKTDHTQDTSYKASGTWDTYYHGVWHLNENPSLDDLPGQESIKDSTTYGNNASSQNTMRSVDSVPGAFGDGGKSIYFDGSNDVLEIPMANKNRRSLQLSSNNFTIEMWYWNSGTTGAHQSMLTHGSFDKTNEWAYYMPTTDNGTITFGTNSVYTTLIQGTNLYGKKVWRQTVCVRNGNNAYLYSSGKLFDTGINYFVGCSYSSSKPILFGARRSTVNERWWKGKLDEVRISLTNRTDGWIRTNYSSQSTPTKFFYLGAEENSSPFWGNSKYVGLQSYKVSSGFFKANVTGLSPGVNYFYKFYMSTTSNWSCHNAS